MEAAYVRLRDKAHSIAIARTGLRKNFVAGVLARAGGAEIEEGGGIYVRPSPVPVRHARNTTRTTARQINVDQAEQDGAVHVHVHVHYTLPHDVGLGGPGAARTSE